MNTITTSSLPINNRLLSQMDAASLVNEHFQVLSSTCTHPSEANIVILGEDRSNRENLIINATLIEKIVRDNSLFFVEGHDALFELTSEQKRISREALQLSNIPDHQLRFFGWDNDDPAIGTNIKRRLRHEILGAEKACNNLYEQCQGVFYNLQRREEDPSYIKTLKEVRRQYKSLSSEKNQLKARLDRLNEETTQDKLRAVTTTLLGLENLRALTKLSGNVFLTLNINHLFPQSPDTALRFCEALALNGNSFFIAYPTRLNDAN